MNIHQGDNVLVNLAPFIGSARPSSQSIPCSVLAITETHVEVTTLEPFRTVSLWVSSRWIDSKLGLTESQLLSA